jgi:hypothetical protein
MLTVPFPCVTGPVVFCHRHRRKTTLILVLRQVYLAPLRRPTTYVSRTRVKRRPTTVSLHRLSRLATAKSTVIFFSLLCAKSLPAVKDRIASTTILVCPRTQVSRTLRSQTQPVKTLFARTRHRRRWPSSQHQLIVFGQPIG